MNTTAIRVIDTSEAALPRVLEMLRRKTYPLTAGEIQSDANLAAYVTSLGQSR